MTVFPVDHEIELVLVEEDLAEELFALVDADRERLRQWLPWVDTTRSPEDTRAFLRTAREGFAAGDALQTAMRYGGRIVGTIGMRIDRKDATGEIGYWVAADVEGKGIVTRAARAMCRIGFEDQGLARIEIRCAPENERSAAVPERLGFTLEGTLRRAERLTDRTVDQRVYSLLASEWGVRGGSSRPGSTDAAR